MNNDLPNVNPGSETLNGTTPTGETPTAGTGETPGTTPLSPEDARKEIERLTASLKRANAEAKEHRETAAELRKFKEQTETEKLSELERRDKRIAELEPLAEIAERYQKLATQVRESVQAETKNWPKEVLAFYPGNDAPVEQLNEWFERSKPLIEKLQVQARGTNPGNRPNPTPNGGTPETQLNKHLEQMRRSGKYGV